MKGTFISISGVTTYLLLVFVAGLLFPLSTSAQESCGNIVEIENGVRTEEPIVDCNNPFGAPHINPDLTVSFGETTLQEGETYTFLNETRQVLFSGVSPSADYVLGNVYLQDGQDYILVDGFFDEELYAFYAAGTYTIVVEEGDLSVSSNSFKSLFYRLKGLFINTAYAFHGPAQVLTFTVTEPEPEIDPLVLQYEPILYLHPDENYQPMNVEAFVEASSLWSTEGIGDTLIKAGGSSDPVTLDDISVGEGSTDWYLQFSGGSLNSKTFDPDIASAAYQGLVDIGKAVPTYYSYKMTDSFIDNNGILQEYIVLQYWYFYAFNDWAEHGGFNNHEGDWESVFVFLNATNMEPKYVAYSAHLNDGNPNGSIFQYDSVRRKWGNNEIETDGDQVKSYVALGSHANYPNNTENGIHETNTENDLTSLDGNHLTTDSWVNKGVIFSTLPNWIPDYEGSWGTNASGIGAQAPKGPGFLKPEGIAGIGSVIRFQEPIKWAGIDKIAETTTQELTNTLVFPKQQTKMVFQSTIPIGTIISVDQHDEFISFGENIENIGLLPHFWDFGTSLENDTFEVAVELGYDPNEVVQLEATEDELVIFFYNEDTNIWESAPSVIDTVANTISFTTTHFSRYAIGVEEPLTIEELVAVFKEELSNSDTEKSTQKKINKEVDKLKKNLRKEKYKSILKDIQKLEKLIEQQTKRGNVNFDVSTKLLEILRSIRELVPQEEQDLECKSEDDHGHKSGKGDGHDEDLEEECGDYKGDSDRNKKSD